MKVKLRILKENQDRINVTTIPFTTELLKHKQSAKQQLFSIRADQEDFKVVLFMEKVLQKEFGNVNELKKDKEAYSSVIFHIVLNTLELLMRKTPKEVIDFIENSVKNTKQDMILRHSKTAPLEQFSVRDFIEEFKEGITTEQAQELFEELGRGDFRTVFRMPQGFVLKVGNSEEGNKINREEIQELELLHRTTNKKNVDSSIQKLFVKPIARAEDFSWTLFEKIEFPFFEPEKFKQKYQNVVDYIEVKMGDRARNFRDVLESFETGILSGELDIDELASLIKNYPELNFIWHHQEEPWTRDLDSANVGLREDGSVVIFDIGHNLSQ